jgi:nitrous oxidase accessory protein NosD
MSQTVKEFFGKMSGKQVFALLCVISICATLMVQPQLATSLVPWGQQVTQDTIHQQIEDYIDQGVGGSPYQTWKSYDAGLLTVDVGGTDYYCYMEGESGKLVSFNTNSTLVQEWISGNLTSGGRVYVQGVAWNTAVDYSLLSIVENVDGTVNYLGSNSFYYAGQNRTDVIANPTQPYTYIISKSGSLYYLKNCATGAVTVNVDAATQLLAAFTGLGTSGGTVYIKKGDYEISSLLIRYDKDDWGIIGEDGARLYAATGFADNILYVSVCENVRIENLEVDGVKSSQSYLGDNSKQHGIYITQSNNVLVDSVYVHDCVGSGIYLRGSSHLNCNITIQNCEITKNGLVASPSRSGIHSYYTDNVRILHNYFADNYRINLAIVGVSSADRVCDFIIEGNVLNGTIDSGTDSNFLAFYANNGTISNNIVLNAKTSRTTADGIRIESSNQWVITSNLVRNNLLGIYCNYNNVTNIIITSNIVIDNSDNGITLNNVNGALVTSNIVSNNGGYAISMASYTSDVTISFNRFSNNIAGVYEKGAVSNTIIKDNQGYVTENSGSSTGTGAQQTVAHGLVGTPTIVILSNGNATANPYQSAVADATNIYVTADSGETWYWQVTYTP